MNKNQKSLLIINCPHCNDFIIIEKIACNVFRHGILKSSLKQINPHSPKKICDLYVKNNLIYGCGKPFTIKNNKGEICKYI